LEDFEDGLGEAEGLGEPCFAVLEGLGEADLTSLGDAGFSTGFGDCAGAGADLPLLRLDLVGTGSGSCSGSFSGCFCWAGVSRGGASLSGTRLARELVAEVVSVTGIGP
jgi:hypothetical protein